MGDRDSIPFSAVQFGMKKPDCGLLKTDATLPRPAYSEVYRLLSTYGERRIIRER